MSLLRSASVALLLALPALPADSVEHAPALFAPDPGGAAPRGATTWTPPAARPERARADSVDALVRRAGELRDGDPRMAAELFGRAAGVADPGTAAWLRLSQAQAAARAGDTATVRRASAAIPERSAVPRDSVRLARARAALVAGNTAAGTEAGRGLDGAVDPVLWAERLGPALLAAGDTTAARRGLREAAGADPGAGAVDLLLGLDPGWPELARLARWDHAAGRNVRAVRSLGRALEAAPAPERARLWRLRAEAELGAGRPGAAHRSADRGLRAAPEPGLRAELELILARTHFARGEGGQAEVHLLRGREAGGGERSARAGYLLADRAHDRGRTRRARDLYRSVAGAYPGTTHGGIARMRLGLLAFREGRHGSAVRHFRAYRRARPGGGWATASVYWEGRALASGGFRAAAEGRFRSALRRDPVSWYGLRSAHRLEADPLASIVAGEEAEEGARPSGREDQSPAGPSPARPSPVGGAEGREAGDAAAAELLDRMDRLRRLGWPGRSLAEFAAADVDSVAGGRRLGLADRLNEAGWTGPGIRLGWEVFEDRGGWSLPVLRAVWPLPHREAVVLAASAHSLPPALVAAVVRQESAFDPRAVSRAGAVGLMQIMPTTAADLTGGSADREALMEPAVSLDLGAGYLRSLMRRFDGSVVGALTAYNAGPRRWLRWRRFPEADVDPELLVERIPFGETRRYVKAVLRNVYLYARLYGLEDGERPPAAPVGRPEASGTGERDRGAGAAGRPR